MNEALDNSIQFNSFEFKLLMSFGHLEKTQRAIEHDDSSCGLC